MPPRVPPALRPPLAAALLALTAAAGSVSDGGIAARLRGAPAEGPAIRIGLKTDRAKVTISASGPFSVVDPDTGRPVWKEQYREPLLVTTHGAPPSEERLWRVQVAALAGRAEAEALARKIEREAGAPAGVSYSPDRGSWRVRVGQAASREALAPVLEKVRALGYPDAWAADEPAPGGEAWLRLVDRDYATVATALRRAVVTASGGALLAVDGKKYRGSLELRVDASAGLRVINALPLEEYLRGVVPAELGPALWPELEALKAQSVAARTYAVRNLGRFSEEGFDLCDTPRCQVYEGASAEHALSDRAIRETAGTIAAWQGEPINALYTSTCGGHTEDGGEIFPEEARPYLRGVSCYPEEKTLKRQGTVVDGAAVADAGGPAGEIAAAALLATAGIVSAPQMASSWRRGPLDEALARDLIEKTGRALGLNGRIGQGRAAASRLGFSLALGDRLWSGEGEDRILDARDLPALLPFTDAEAIPEADRPLAAALAHRGLLPAATGGALWPEGLLERGEALAILQRAAALYGVPEILEGTLLQAGGRKLRFRGSVASGRPVPLASPGRLALFLDSGSGPVPHQRVALYPGDRVRAALDGDGEVRSLVVLPARKGLSDDRYSPHYAWETSMTSVELDRKIAERFEIGSVRDLVPLRRGVSGRIVALRLVGERGEATVTGFNVRLSLGLKESLFVVDKLRWADGSLRRVVFAGKGWGHGVGMCQVGAYGMAVRGASSAEILRHYYTDIELVRLY